MGSNFIPRAELPESFDTVLNELARSGDEYYVTDSGRPRAVLIDVDKYHAMMDMIEASQAAAPKDVDAKVLKSMLDAEAEA